jgi:hypothetical protein
MMGILHFAKSINILDVFLKIFDLLELLRLVASEEGIASCCLE